MKRLVALFLFISLLSRGSACVKQDSLAALEGLWYVSLSNFKMWLKRDKYNPTFTYSLATKKGVKGLKDVVSYEKRGGRRKQITGFDRPENSAGTAFTWRGKGWLALFRSKWQIVYSTGDWSLIHFEKTLVTAAGYDVISRNSLLSAEQLAAVATKLKALGISDLQPVLR